MISTEDYAEPKKLNIYIESRKLPLFPTVTVTFYRVTE
jgi:hypothetical protein